MKINKFKNNNLKELEIDNLSGLLRRGVSIIKGVGFIETCEDLSRVKSDFFIWNSNINNFLVVGGASDIVKSIFFEPDIKFKYYSEGGAGIDIESEFCQSLKKWILKETKNKLSQLRENEKELLKVEKIIKENKVYENATHVLEIICVEPNEENKLKLVINGNYVKFLECNATNKCWTSLLKIANDGFADYNKSDFDYFNSNPNNIICTQGGYKMTKILKQAGNQIYPNIKLKTITGKTFKTRSNKMLKRNLK